MTPASLPRILGATRPNAVGRTYIITGNEAPTLKELVNEIAEAAHVPARSRHLPGWPFWVAGAICAAVCVPFGIEPAIFRTSRPATSSGTCQGASARRSPAHVEFVPEAGLDLIGPCLSCDTASGGPPYGLAGAIAKERRTGRARDEFLESTDRHDAQLVMTAGHPAAAAPRRGVAPPYRGPGPSYGRPAEGSRPA